MKTANNALERLQLGAMNSYDVVITEGLWSGQGLEGSVGVQLVMFKVGWDGFDCTDN